MFKEHVARPAPRGQAQRGMPPFAVIRSIFPVLHQLLKAQSHHLEKLITTTRKRLGWNSNIETWSIFIKDKNPIRFYHKHETLTSILPSETNITVWKTVMLVECAFQLEVPTPYQSWGRCLELLQNESVHHCKHN